MNVTCGIDQCGGVRGRLVALEYSSAFHFRPRRIDLRMRCRRCGLFAACVGGDDSVEAPGEVERGLAGSAGAVPPDRASRCQRGGVVEQRRRIPGAEIRVATRDTGKVVVERLAQGCDAVNSSARHPE